MDGSKKEGMFITKLTAGASAEASGKITVGVSVLSLNGVSLNGKLKKECTPLIEEAASPSTLEFTNLPENYAAFTEAKSHSDSQ